jgi:8-oxo-dGTP pyrophosphatase MutT (NUDIX family)
MKDNKKTPYCTNCGLYGHYLKNCLTPVTSFGCIVLKAPNGFDQAKELLKNDNSVSGFETIMKDIKYLMIQRKDSLGFIEIIRGKYKLTDVDYIKYHIAAMTKSEQEKLLNNDFEMLWNNLWGIPKEQTLNYKNDKEAAKNKFESLKSGTDCISLELLIKEVNTQWVTPEWGFPKGRRDPKETEYNCAIRELKEETSILEKDIIFIQNLEPISETFFGSNHIHYCHKYYIFLYNSDKDVQFDNKNIHMLQEIGDIGWYSLEECLDKIRPDNIEKKEVLLRTSSLLRNYCPLKLSTNV